VVEAEVTARIGYRDRVGRLGDAGLLLEHGEIVEDGSPEDLIAGGDGRFSDLHQAWLASLA
jgi:hypothetical protein